jgi:hypothetical protein
MDKQYLYKRLVDKYGFREVKSMGIKYLLHNKQAIVCDVNCTNPFMVRIRNHFIWDPKNHRIDPTYGDLYAITDEEGIDKKIQELLEEYEDCKIKFKLWQQKQKENKIIDMFE